MKLVKTETGTPPSTVAYYTFNVELTKPTAANNYADLTQYTITYTDKDNQEHTVTDSNYSTTNKYSFTVQVPPGATGITINGIPYGTGYTVAENTTGLTGLQNTPSPVAGAIGEATAVNGVSTATITNVYSGNVLTLRKELGANAANYGVTTAKPFTYKVKFNHTNLSTSPLTVSGNGNSNISTPVNDQEYEIKVYPGTPVTISGMRDGTSYEVYEVTPTPTPDSIVKTGTSTAVSSSEPITGSFSSSDHDETASITNAYPATGGVTLKKALTTDTPAGTGNANYDKPFSFTVNFTANGGAKFDPTQYTITTGATVTTALHTTNEAKTTMSCTISL